MEPPAKKPKVDEAALMRHLGDHLQSQKDSITQQTGALQVAMRMLLRDEFKPWRKFPDELRNNPTCVQEALRSKQGRKAASYSLFMLPFIQLSDIPATMLENNRDIQLEAVKSSLIPWDEVRPKPQEWRQSKTLSTMALLKGRLIQNLREDAPLLTQEEVQELLQNQTIRWDNVPTDLQDDLEFCGKVALIPEGKERFSFERNDRPPLACHILRRHNSFRADEAFWRKLVAEYPHQFKLRYLFERNNFVPAALINDAEFIRQACEKDDFVLAEIPTTDLVVDLVRKDPKKLGCVSFDFVQTHLDLVVSLLEAFRRSLSRNDYGYAHHLFQNMPFSNDSALSMAWIEAGLPVGENLPDEWAMDRDKFLLVAQHCHDSFWRQCSFGFASRELRNDASFIKAAMEFDPCLFAEASEGIRHTNFELAVWALCDSSFLQSWRGGDIVSRHRSQAERELAMYNAFVNPFLTAVCDKNDGACVLTKLDEVKIKSLIAEFVGIRRGPTLHHIRGAVANIAAHTRRVE